MEQSSNSEPKFDFLFNVVEENMGFVPNSMRAMSEEPALLGSFSMLSGLILGDPRKTSPKTILKLIFKNMFWSSKYMKRKDRIPITLRHLVAHITSKAAGCQYCQAHTIGNAKMSGVKEEKLNAIWDFEESSIFSEQEKSALRFALAAGTHPNAVTSDHFEDLKTHFTRKQILELGAVVSLFGFLNRWNETFATQLEEPAIAHAHEYLSEKGWTIGRHDKS